MALQSVVLEIFGQGFQIQTRFVFFFLFSRDEAFCHIWSGWINDCTLFEKRCSIGVSAQFLTTFWTGYQYPINVICNHRAMAGCHFWSWLNVTFRWPNPLVCFCSIPMQAAASRSHPVQKGAPGAKTGGTLIMKWIRNIKRKFGRIPSCMNLRKKKQKKMQLYNRLSR